MYDNIILTRHICLLALAITCAYTDAARRKLYNPATLGGLGLGLALAYLLDVYASGLPHLQDALLGALASGGLFFIIYLMGGMGAGDLKFMAAVGALGGGWRFALLAMVYTALIGAALALCVLIWQKRLWRGLKNSVRVCFTFRRKKDADSPPTTVPYGVAIACGSVWAWMELFVLG